MIVNIAKTTVTSGTDTYPSARFVFAHGKAAVWIEDTRLHSAHRVLYAENAEFIKPPTAKLPMRLIAANQEWEIRQARGGCGCGSPTKHLTFEQLLDPNLTEIG